MGEVFAGRYELLEPIADGGMGSVWTVLDLTDDSVKAAKILRQSDASSLLRFMREQSVRIDHDHVVTPTSWAGMDDRMLFTMPLIRGGSVADLLGDFHRLPIGWTVELLRQILRGLQAVHTAGIVHRDLKPANLLLDATGSGRPHLRVTDFGVAAPIDAPRLTRASQVLGSPGYMAPEQLQGADPDPLQDIYAVGMLGLEMVSGERPPRAADAARHIAAAEPEQADLVALLERATAADAAQRPPSAQAFLAELSAVPIPNGPNDGVELPFVFDHFAEQLPVVSPDVSTSAPTPPNPPSVPVPLVGTGPIRRVDPRRTGLVLIIIGVLSAIGAIAVLLA